MLKILQGTNSPITVTFYQQIDDVTNWSCVLSSDQDTLKHWTLEDVVAIDRYLILPIRQAESLSWEPTNHATLEIKCLDGEGMTDISNKMIIKIEERHDTAEV